MPSDGAECNPCPLDAFSSSLEPLSTVFPPIIVFSEPANPVLLWTTHHDNFVFEIRRRDLKVPDALKVLETKYKAELYAMLEVIAALRYPSHNASQIRFLGKYDELPKLPTQNLKPFEKKAEDLEQIVEFSTKRFNSEQSRVLNL